MYSPSAHPRCRWICFFIRFGEMCLCISVSPMDALQWMGAVRMRVQTADKNITIIHRTLNDGFICFTNVLLFPLQEWLEGCGLLWCFYQLFGLILTAPIHCRGHIGKQVIAMQSSPNLFWRRNKLIYILDDLRVSTFSANVIFCVNYSFNNHCVIKIWARFVIWCFCFSSPFVVILCLYCSRLACFRVVTV